MQQLYKNSPYQLPCANESQTSKGLAFTNDAIEAIIASKIATNPDISTIEIENGYLSLTSA